MFCAYRVKRTHVCSPEKHCWLAPLTSDLASCFSCLSIYPPRQINSIPIKNASCPTRETKVKEKVIFSPDHGFYASSFLLCLRLASMRMENDQSWVEAAPLWPWAPPERRELVQTCRLLPADRLLTMSLKAFEDQASSFARRSLSVP